MNEREIFAGAMERGSEAERAAFLDGACGGDVALRGRIEGLLREQEELGSFLESPHAALAGAVGDVTADAPSERPGTVIGPYKLLEPIGEGGMGTVYMAEQARPVRRMVALKVIKAGMDSRQVLARFQAERQALALMDHPNIAKVLDAGATEQGRPYFVMELVKGVPITRFCDERRLTPRERLELFIPVCQAVQHAHQKGIIHRDLKPSNVLVALYDSKPVPKVIDFGVAKATGQKLTEATLFTGFGHVVGTPEYMSPEQAELNQLDIDTRSDVYSLGVLLYELLTGTTPLDRKRLKQAALLEVLRVIREEEPPRPSTRLSTTEELPSIAANRNVEPRKLAGLVRGELDWIVMKALEKDRNRRYETANALAADLRRHLDDEPVLACPPSAGYRLRKAIRRHRVGVAAAAVITLSLVLGLAAAVYAAVRINWARNQAVAAQRGETRAKNDALASAEVLRRRDYVSRVNLAYRECLGNNIARALELLDGCPNDLRAWEWEYVRRQCHLDLQTLREPSQGVNAVAFSPDGRLVATGSGPFWLDREPGDLVVREWATGREVFARRGLADGIRGLAFSPDGRLVAATNSRDVSVWEVATGRERFRRTEPAEAGWLRGLGVAFSPDGRTILVGYGTYNDHAGVGYALLLDATTGGERGPKIRGHAGGVWSVAYSPDGGQVALTSSDLVEVWDVAARRPVLALRGHTGFVYGVAFSPNGKYLATCGHDRTIRLWDRADGAEIRTFRGHEGFVRTVAFSPDGTRIVSGSEDNAVKLWAVSSERELATFPGHQQFVHSVAFSPDGTRIATGSLDRTTKIWAAAPSLQPTFRLGSWVIGAAFSPDNHTVAAAVNGDSGWPRLEVRDLKTSEVKLLLPGLVAPDLVFRPDGRWLIWGGPNAVEVWDVKAGRRGHVLSKVPPQWKGLACRPSDRMVLAACSDGTARAWDTETGREDESKRFSIVPAIVPAKEQNFNGRNPGCAAFSPDGRRLAVAAVDRSVKVYDVEAGQELFVLRGHEFPILALAFSPDRRRIVSAAGGMLNSATEMKVWDGATGQELGRLFGHTDGVFGVAFSPNGRRIASASFDRDVKLWDTETFEEVFTLRGHTAAPLALAFSPDGRRIASGGIDLELRLWDIDAPDADSIVRREAAARREQDVTRLKNETLNLARQGKWEAYRRIVDQIDRLREQSPSDQALSRVAFDVRKELNNAVWMQIRFEAPRELAAGCAAAMQEAAEARPEHPSFWNTLGVARYRAGDWTGAIAACEQSRALDPNRSFAYDGFFLAMAHYQIGHKEESQSWFDRSVAWMDQKAPNHDDLRRFRAEAAELLGIVDDQMPNGVEAFARGP